MLKNTETKQYVLHGKDFDMQQCTSAAARSSASRCRTSRRRQSYGYNSLERNIVDKNTLWKYRAVREWEEIFATGPTTVDYEVLVYLTTKDTKFEIDVHFTQERIFIFVIFLCFLSLYK